MNHVHILRDEAEVAGILDRLVPLIGEQAQTRDASGELPAAALQAIAESGLLALNVPRRHGGVQASALTIAQVYRRIAEADPSVAQSSSHTSPRSMHWTGSAPRSNKRSFLARCWKVRGSAMPALKPAASAAMSIWSRG